MINYVCKDKMGEKPGVWCTPSAQHSGGRDKIFDFKGSLVYGVSDRTAREETLSQKTKRQETKAKPKPKTSKSFGW